MRFCKRRVTTIKLNVSELLQHKSSGDTDPHFSLSEGFGRGIIEAAVCCATR